MSKGTKSLLRTVNRSLIRLLASCTSLPVLPSSHSPPSAAWQSWSTLRSWSRGWSRRGSRKGRWSWTPLHSGLPAHRQTKRETKIFRRSKGQRESVHLNYSIHIYVKVTVLGTLALINMYVYIYKKIYINNLWPMDGKLLLKTGVQKDHRRLRLTLSKGMLYFFRMDGEISVILCRRKASQPWLLPGKKPGDGN